MDVVPQSVHWLVPEENCPCDIFLYFRGKFALAVPSGQKVSVPILDKLSKAKCTHFYLKKIDLQTWKAWKETRHIVSISQAIAKEDTSTLYGNKRAELVSYLQKHFGAKDIDKNPSLREPMEKSLWLVQKVIKSPMLDWYFQQFHEPPTLFQHNGRVAISSACFCLLQSLANEQEIENLIFASIIHELSGDPVTSLKTVVSTQTLSALEKFKRPVPERVIQLIKMQDELCSGAGFPLNLKIDDLPMIARVFSLFNHLDHYKLKDAASRRARMEYAKQQMTARKQDYDPILWNVFWTFCEKQTEML